MTGVNSLTATIGLLALAAGMLYFASRAGADALARSSRRAEPRAISCALPIFATAMAAVLTHRASIALAVIFATTIASLSLVLGSLSLMAIGAPRDAIKKPLLTGINRGWALLLPAVVIPLVAAFSGYFSPTHAGLMLLVGLAILVAWNSPSGIAALASVPAPAPSEGKTLDYFGPAAAPQPTPRRPLNPSGAILRGIELLLALALMVVGAGAAMHGLGRLEAAGRWIGDTALAVMVFSPVLILPLLNTATIHSADDGGRGLTDLAVSVALLNLCVTLPIAALTWYGLSSWKKPHLWFIHSASGYAWTGASGAFLAQPDMPVALGFAVVHVLMLLIVVLWLLPTLLGRWAIGAMEAVGLLAIYVLYLALIANVSARLAN